MENSIFGLLDKNQLAWGIYGYTSQPLTRQDFTDISNAPDSRFGLFADFQAAAKTQHATYR